MSTILTVHKVESFEGDNSRRFKIFMLFIDLNVSYRILYEDSKDNIVDFIF